MLKSQQQQIEAARIAAQTTQANRSLNLNTLEKMARTQSEVAMHDATIMKDRKDAYLKMGTELYKDMKGRQHSEKQRDRDLVEKVIEGRNKPKKGE